MNKNRVSVYAILGIGYAIFGVIVLGLCVYAIMRIGFIDDNLKQINNINSVKQRVAIDFRGSVHDRSIAIRDVVLHTPQSKESLESIIEDIEILESNYTNARDRMKTLFEINNGLGPQEKEILSRIDAINAKALPLINEIISLTKAGSEQAAFARLQEVRPMFVSWLGVINEFINLEESKNQAITPLVADVVVVFKIVFIISVVLSIVLGVGIAFFIIRYLSKILGGEPNVASGIVRHIASGNLQESITAPENSMLKDIANMQAKLKSIVSEILTSAQEIFTNTKAVEEANANSQKASMTQSDTAKSSATQIAKIAQGITQITEIAKQTEENSAKTLESAKKGKEAMADTQATIDEVTQMVNTSAGQILELEKQSNEISSSTNLIAEIADQTNLLALNAAIEAARAGEHGRGFAVVADEVRKLAERTQESTAQISTIIKHIQDEIKRVSNSMNQAVPRAQKSIELAEQTSALLDEIEAQATDSLAKAQSVSTQSNEQEESVVSVEQRMQEMVQISNDTNILMEKARTAIAELSKISTTLKENIGFFKL
ncbi:methyl-accepting chemotaxis protein [Helicobacter canis]|uniref:methyl-accepting chemotaxis protein n=1 Tax=Helicobacter canis TaxID=29419 RepID=UPI0026EC251D|nr:methyl-accepting chemotaxis protein [Helicobacter canis]